MNGTPANGPRADGLRADGLRADGLRADGLRADGLRAYRMLRNRLSIFVSLPMGSLDKLALQEKLDSIGKTGA